MRRKSELRKMQLGDQKIIKKELLLGKIFTQHYIYCYTLDFIGCYHAEILGLNYLLGMALSYSCQCSQLCSLLFSIILPK